MKRTVDSTREKQRDHFNDRIILAARYADCLGRLAVNVSHLGMGDLADALCELSRAINRMANDLAVCDYGIVVLGRTGRLIGTVERLVAKKGREAVLH